MNGACEPRIGIAGRKALAVELNPNPTIEAAVQMRIIRPAPKSSATGPASWRTHIMLKKMCSSPPCSQEALSSVQTCPSP